MIKIVQYARGGEKPITTWLFAFFGCFFANFAAIKKLFARNLSARILSWDIVWRECPIIHPLRHPAYFGIREPQSSTMGNIHFTLQYITISAFFDSWHATFRHIPSLWVTERKLYLGVPWLVTACFEFMMSYFTGVFQPIYRRTITYRRETHGQNHRRHRSNAYVPFSPIAGQRHKTSGVRT